MEPILLLNGLLCDERLWAAQLRHLPTAKVPDLTHADSMAEMARQVLAEAPERFAGFGGVPAYSTPEAMRSRVEREIARWQKVVETRGIERQ